MNTWKIRKSLRLKRRKEPKEEKEEESDEKMYAKGEEYSDVISSEYLNWMEDTLKSAGVDVAV